VYAGILTGKFRNYIRKKIYFLHNSGFLLLVSGSASLIKIEKGGFMNIGKFFPAVLLCCLIAVLVFDGCIEPVVAPTNRYDGPQKATMVDAATFDSIVLRPGAAIVEFYSRECMLCAGMTWIIDSLFTVFKDSAAVCASETNNDTLWKRFLVTSVPTYVFFLDGTEVLRRSYITNDSSVYDSLSALLKKIISEKAVIPDSSDTTLPDSSDTTIPDTADTVPDLPDTLENGALRLDSANFESHVMISGLPVMVEFFSPLCPHCTVMDSVVKLLTDSLEGQAFFGSVNTLYDDTLSRRFGIYYIPAFLFFKDGLEYHRIIGEVPLDSLIWAIEQGKI
jgi:thioredoxin-like negative regulator of GroEL